MVVFGMGSGESADRRLRMGFRVQGLGFEVAPNISCLAEVLAQVIWMAAFMHKTEKGEGVVLDLIIEQIRERPAFAAGVAVGTYVVAALSVADGPDYLANAIVEVVAQPG
jgi:hypothetical protein